MVGGESCVELFAYPIICLVVDIQVDTAREDTRLACFDFTVRTRSWNEYAGKVLLLRELAHVICNLWQLKLTFKTCG